MAETLWVKDRLPGLLQHELHTQKRRTDTERQRNRVRATSGKCKSSLDRTDRGVRRASLHDDRFNSPRSHPRRNMQTSGEIVSMCIKQKLMDCRKKRTDTPEY